MGDFFPMVRVEFYKQTVVLCTLSAVLYSSLHHHLFNIPQSLIPTDDNAVAGVETANDFVLLGILAPEFDFYAARNAVGVEAVNPFAARLLVEVATGNDYGGLGLT